jgi:hypothetical protein
MKYIIPVLFCFLTGCLSSKKANNVLPNNSAALNFVNSNKYSYTTYTKYIPDVVLDSLKQINKWKYGLGDSSIKADINLTDANLKEFYYDEFLHFALVNDSICLLTYTQGGRGAHIVVDFIQYKNKFVYLRYNSLEKITDFEKQKAFLKTNPQPVVIR